jgi:hypothetical protein
MDSKTTQKVLTQTEAHIKKLHGEKSSTPSSDPHRVSGKSGPENMGKSDKGNVPECSYRK